MQHDKSVAAGYIPGEPPLSKHFQVYSAKYIALNTSHTKETEDLGPKMVFFSAPFLVMTFGISICNS